MVFSTSPQVPARRTISLADGGAFSGMPDLGACPALNTGASSLAFGGIESTGFRLEFIPMKIGDGMTILIEGENLQTDTNYINIERRVVANG